MGERIELAKIRTRRDLVVVEGRGRIHKVRKGESEPYETTDWTTNTIVSNGWTGILNLLAGVYEHNLKPENAQIRIAGAPGSPFPVQSIELATPTKPSPSIAYAWKAADVSTNEYTVTTVELWRVASGALEPEPPQFQVNSLSPGWGTKTAGENWYFEIVLEFYSGASDVGDPMYLKVDGMEHMLNILSGGVEGGEWGPEDGLTKAKVRLLRNFEDESGLEPDGPTVVDTTERKLGWLFIDPADDDSDPEEGDPSEWDVTSVVYDPGGEHIIIREGPCRPGGPNNGSCGVKYVDEEWQYRYEIVFSQGS